MSLPTRIVVVLACGLLVAGCRVRGDVEIRLRGDGSGSVAATLVLDADAVRRLERYAQGPFENQVLVLDLVAAGWRTDGWERRSDGVATLRLEHPFSDPSQVSDLVAAIVGDSDVVSRVVVRHDRGVLRSSDRVSAIADLTEVESGLATDDVIRERLTNVGVDPRAVDLLLTAQLRDALTLGLRVSVRGDRESVVVQFGEQAAASASAGSFDAGRAMVLALAGLLVFVGMVAIAIGAVSRVRDRAPGRAREESG